MAVTILGEALDSRQVNMTSEGKTVTRKFRVDTTDPEEAMTLIPPRGEPHPDMPDFVVTEASLSPVTEADDRVILEVTYRQFPANAPVPLLPLFSGGIPYREIWEWDVAAQQEHITSVRDPTYAQHFPAESSTVGTAIGAQGDDIEGVDVNRSVLTMRVTQLVPFLSLNDALQIVSMRDTVNNAPWIVFLPGEVLFTGANISTTDDGWAQIVYTFQVSFKQPAFFLTVGFGATEQSTIVDLAPWDYFWVIHGEATQGEGEEKISFRYIESAHIARVYDPANFGVFGLLGP